MAPVVAEAMLRSWLRLIQDSGISEGKELDDKGKNSVRFNALHRIFITRQVKEICCTVLIKRVKLSN